MKPLLALDNAGVRFGTVAALHDVALQVHRGDFIALIGANGSGKTTLLQALHGLVPHTGTRVVDTQAATQVMVFQRPFMLRLSVWNNLRLALWLAGVPAAERTERAAQALQRAGLVGLRDRPARALSGGQQQRLALARAWALHPEVLLLDEPTASLDPTAKREVEALIAEAVAEAPSRTLVFASHNLGQVKRLASRVIYLEQGRVVADLPVHDFFHGPLPDAAHLFVKGELA